MTNKLKNFLKIVTLILFVGCNENSEPILEQEQQTESLTNTYYTTKVTLDDIPEISSYLGVDSKKGLVSKNGSQKAIFNFDEILEVVDTLGHTNYSINFSMVDTPYNVMYNLVVGVDALGQKTNPLILKLTSDKDSYKSWAENNFDFSHFTGTLDLHKFSSFFGDFTRFKNTTSKNDCIQFDAQGDPIPCNRNRIEGGNPNSGGGRPNGGRNTGGGSGVVTTPDNSGSGCTINTYWRTCGGSNEYDAHGSSTCGGDGGGAGWVISINCGNNGGSNHRPPLEFNKNSTTGNSDCTDCNTGLSGGVGVNTGVAMRIDILVDNLHQEIGLTPTEIRFLKKQDNWELTGKVISFWNTSDKTDEAKAFVKYAIKILEANPNANPFLGADCRSFEYAKPPGALQRGCAVKDFDHTFYTAGVRSNGNSYYGEIDVPVNLLYFTMPTWMTNGRAANLTAVAVTGAIKATDVHFFNNPDISKHRLASFFRDQLKTQMASVGGRFSTTIAPFPIRNPAPYITSILGISNPFDCE
ncbi:hypothetical protein [uncultured Algibacter sp.]|uniref:hypothetical protein n=1 Tax=uncultured Algibacter sp. TaxID=298659 RepID=UPI003217D6C9